MRFHVTVRAASQDGLAAIHRLAARLEPRVRDEFLQAIENVQGFVDIDALGRAIRKNDPRAAEALLHLDDLPEELQPMVETLRGIFHGAGTAAARELELVLGEPLRFDLVNPRSVRWAAEYSSTLIRRITSETRAAVRVLIANGIENGVAPLSTAREIVKLVGLTGRQAQAVVRYRLDLEAQERATAQVDRMVARYGRQLLTRRGQLIARTETIASSSRGQLEAWHYAVGQGLLVPSRTKQRWSATGDDRTCPICMDLDGQEVGLYESFESPTVGPLACSPAHPGCRCSAVLVIES